LSYIPTLRKWRVEHAKSYPVLASRVALYENIVLQELRTRPIDYLEFGVGGGESFAIWLGLNSAVESNFYGFDTFTGLPEDWPKLFKTVKAGTFNVGGRLPSVTDSRASFFKGLFQQTLPTFLADYKICNQLVVHIDCDLYSAALYALIKIDCIVRPGTIIIFDEFTSLLHEFRALEDYCAACMRSYDVIGATPDDVQVAIRIK
jgi:hypothetical protein